MRVMTWTATGISGVTGGQAVDLCAEHSVQARALPLGARLPHGLPTPVSVSHGLHSGLCQWCDALGRAAAPLTRYFVVAAPCHYGDATRVVSSHRTLEAARAAAGVGYVVREGGLAKGDQFLRASEGVYPTHTSAC